MYIQYSIFRRRMDVKQVLTVVFSLLLMIGCGESGEKARTAENPKPDAVETALPDFRDIATKDVFVYDCADSLRLSAHVTPDSAWIFLPDTALRTKPVRSGSGARYEAGPYLFWSKDDEALLQLREGSLMKCTTMPREKAWQAARLRGVDFRALGQEPGWYLEIRKGQQMKYVGNYGRDTLIVSSPKAEENPQKNVHEAPSLKVEITSQECTDAMSGFKFPQTVRLTVEGNTYTGCGRFLN